MKAITALAVVVVACAGCSTLKNEPIRVSDGSHRKTVGTVTTWSPDKAAAVVVDNKVCMQLPTRIVSLSTGGKGLVAVDGNGIPISSGGKIKGAAGGDGNFQSTAAPTFHASERVTFLSHSLFYLCQLAMNGALEKSQVTEMMQFLVAESAKIAPPPEPVVLRTTSIPSGQSTPQHKQE